MSPEQVVLSKDTHDNIMDMMKSVDTENRVVALNCLENVDFNKNVTYILLLRMQGEATQAEWSEHAPNASKMLRGLGINVDSSLTWKQILGVLIKRKVPAEDIQFYLDRFATHLSGSIRGLGYDFIDTIEIKVKVKTEHGEQSRTVSESV
jgi:hypothetical protein